MKGLFDRAAHIGVTPTPLETYRTTMEGIQRDVANNDCTVKVYDISDMGPEYACELFKLLTAGPAGETHETLLWNPAKGLLYLQITPRVPRAETSK